MTRIVVNLPVNRSCNFMLLATGQYDRQSVANFIRMLQLNIELGAFDEEDPPGKHEYVDCPQGTGCRDCIGWKPDGRPEVSETDA